MAIICSFSCRFQIYRHFFFLFNNLGDNCGIYIMGYLDILTLQFCAKGQGHLQYLTSDISAITRNF